MARPKKIVNEEEIQPMPLSGDVVAIGRGESYNNEQTKQAPSADGWSANLQKIIDSGIPLRKCIFQSAVNNGLGTPEHQFDQSSGSKDRHVNMWLTPVGVVCEHKGKYFGTPSANVMQYFFK
jgi:hypothetical protein